MYREYDLFEKFSDGSSLWRAAVLGLESTLFHLRALAKKSGNQFYAMDVLSGKIVYSHLEEVGLNVLTPHKIGKRSRSATA